jgi:hypothetical protein
MPKNKNKGTSVDFPIDHPDVEKHYKFKKKSEMARNRAQQLTATEGSFAKGGLVRSGKPKIATKGWR